jgi:hypothetical protein
VLGECKVIEEVMIGEDSLIRFSGCKVRRWLCYCSVELCTSLHVLVSLPPLTITACMASAFVEKCSRSPCV